MRNRFQTVHIVFNALASLFILFSGILLIPLIVVIVSGETAEGIQNVLAFVLPAALSLGLGLGLRLIFKGGNPNTLQAMLICALGWLGFSMIGAIPFVIGIHAGYIDSVFETTSGFTTTGITMFTGLESLPRSIIFWRALTQWVGGLGILTFFLVTLHRGGSTHQLFGAESHKIDAERPVPGMVNTIKILWGFYTIFTLVIATALVAVHMSLFDSICHTFTVLSTGGFSPHDASIEYYRLSGHPHYVAIEYILMIGMLLGGISFLVHYRIFKGDWKALFNNTEMKTWWFIIGCFFLIILGERILKLHPFNGNPLLTIAWWRQLEENVRLVLFQVISILTTTGFSTRDIGSPFFGQAARQLFLVMMVIGGCVGSTGGGIKVLRISILTKLIRREIFRMRTPTRTISSVIVDGKPISTNEVYRATSLFFIWMILLVFGGSATALLSDLDAYSSFSGMFSALGNIGPCYIPVKVNSLLHPVIKLVYIFGMLAGRLEILPVLLLFNPKAWRS
ncbi:TrkH family potassium uptake protein [bacterium]|nr:TrkH family potassium uptake protein [bacterium]RQV96619.1 MAG: TrkH family potassium uptake protein [bacterium]